jgi:hypothetical protein
MIGPLTTAPKGFTHVLVAIDKFTKWIEYKPIAMLSTDLVVTFIYDFLHHFGLPTLSLQIWDPISTHISSGIFVNAIPLKSNMFQWPTRGPIAKLSVPTA